MGQFINHICHECYFHNKNSFLTSWQICLTHSSFIPVFSNRQNTAKLLPAKCSCDVHTLHPECCWLNICLLDWFVRLQSHITGTGGGRNEPIPSKRVVRGCVGKIRAQKRKRWILFRQCRTFSLTDDYLHRSVERGEFNPYWPLVPYIRWLVLRRYHTLMTVSESTSMSMKTTPRLWLTT